MRALACVFLLLALPLPAVAVAPVFGTRTMTRLPAPRSNMAVVATGGTIYCMGGNVDETSRAQAWAYDTAARTWTELPPMQEARSGHAAVVVGNRILVLGGTRLENGAVRWVRHIEALDLETRRWSAVGIAPFDRTRFAALAVSGRILLIGGQTPDEAATASVDILDPTTMTWTRGVALPEGRNRHAAVRLGGDAYVLGGEGPEGVARASVYRYRAGGDGWALAAPMEVPRKNFAATALGARIVVAGGWDMVGERRIFPSEVEVYDGQWRTVGRMAGRDGCRGVAVYGRAWVLGGFDGATLDDVATLGWSSPASRWAIDAALGFHLGWYAERDLPPGAAVVTPPAVGYAPPERADISNINLTALRGLGFPVPGRDHDERYTFFLKFYRYPTVASAEWSARRVLDPLLALETACGDAVAAFVGDAANVLVKKGAIERSDWGFSAVHPFPPLTVLAGAWRLEGRVVTPQEYLDRDVVFSSLYVRPVDAGADSAAGVRAFHAEILGLYREAFAEVEGRGDYSFVDDGDPRVRRVITVPRDPLVFKNFRDLPMPQDPHTFLSGLLLIHEDDYVCDAVGKPRERVRGHVFEVGSVVRIR